MIDARDLARHCNALSGGGTLDCGSASGIPCAAGREEYLNADSGWADLPKWMQANADESSLSWTGHGGGAAPTPNPAPTEPDRLRYQESTLLPLLTFSFSDMVDSGARHRLSGSYTACVGERKTSWSFDVAMLPTNFDLAICGQPAPSSAVPNPAPECLAVSESFDDTNEGFDVVLHKDYSWLAYYLIRPKSDEAWNPCDGASADIPFAWQAIIWAPATW